MNTMQDAFAVAGLRPEDAAFDLAIAKYLNSGGTIERAQARLIAAAERMPGRGLAKRVASSDRLPLAPTRQQVEDGVAREEMPIKGHIYIAAPSSSNRGGEGHNPSARERHLHGALPVREPTNSQRTVAGLIAKASAVTVLDTLKIDGRAIGDWTVAEARAAGKTKTREGRILIEASRVVANAPSNALIRDVIKAAELQIIMQKAAEISDAA